MDEGSQDLVPYLFLFGKDQEAYLGQDMLWIFELEFVQFHKQLDSLEHIRLVLRAKQQLNIVDGNVYQVEDLLFLE